MVHNLTIGRASRFVRSWAGRFGQTRSIRTIRVKAQKPQTPGTLPPEEVTKLVQEHRTLLARLPGSKTNIAGVTFEGRQYHVKNLQRYQGVLLVPEPSNPYDSSAVAVRTVTGVPLGYIPRGQNQRLSQQGILPGNVLSAGPVTTKDVYGASIWFHPDALPLLPLPLPKAVTSPTSQELKAMLSQSSPASRASLAAAGNVCEVTGRPSTPQLPVQAVARWLLDPQRRVARLVRMAAVLAPLVPALNLLNLSPGTAEYQQAENLVRQFNVNWRPEDLPEYLEWAQAEQRRMHTEEWTLDLEPAAPKMVQTPVQSSGPVKRNAQAAVLNSAAQPYSAARPAGSSSESE